MTSPLALWYALTCTVTQQCVCVTHTLPSSHKLQGHTQVLSRCSLPHTTKR